MERIHKILDFWFEGLNNDSNLDARDEKLKKWFIKNKEFDEKIKSEFREDYEYALDGKYSDWENSKEGCLALILLFDQFPRNMFRNSAHMYDADHKAIRIAQNMIEKQWDVDLPYIYRTFIYMPFMHSETVEVQQLCIDCFGHLVDDAKGKDPDQSSYFEYNLKYAQAHHDVVAKFHRFPHRNEILGRPSTNEEIEYLKQEGSSF